MSPLPVIALFGPTAVGKTELALLLARRLRERGLDAVAISADSMQVYRGLETLTGVPSREVRQELEHKLISFVPVTETFSAGQYSKLAHREIDGALAAGKVPIVVGGTGLYLRAALSELSFAPPVSSEVRSRWLEKLDYLGVQALYAELAQKLPVVAKQIDARDSQRIIRALALDEQGYDYSQHPSDELWQKHTRQPTLLVGVIRQREQLYEHIDRRVDEMVGAGVKEEVLAAQNVGASFTARKALGYSQLLEDDIIGMKQLTRRYAKRQLTWMRKLAGIVEIDLTAESSNAVVDRVDHLHQREMKKCEDHPTKIV